MSHDVRTRLLMEPVDGVMVASFSDDALLAEDVVREVEDQFEVLWDGVGAGGVLVNFRGVRFVSSTMLAVLIKFARKVEKGGGRVKVCELAPHLKEVFRLGRFDRFCEVFDDEATALDSFATKQTG